MSGLPIEAELERLRQQLSGGANVVLQAPPGAGKSTRVPLALLAEPWLAGRRIILLEPRRLAARAVAHFMARQLGEQVGQTVGYRMRLDTRVGPATRIEVVTEGVLARMLQSDPALEAVGLVIFDEFHERNLHADLGLALCLDVQGALREDLRLLVMSATLDGERVAELLGNAPIITSAGRSFPVTVRYFAAERDARLDGRVTAAIRGALRDEEGSVLVFLPGVGEIRQVAARLAEMPLPDGVRVSPLYGNLSQAEQDAAIQPAAAGRRKVVLATAIAETSLTIDGIGVVIDSGLMRVPRFDPGTGMARLDTMNVTQASAAQRCGRAGRVAPGVCYRLWSEQAQQGLIPFGRPEILEADLAPMVLELAQWGVTDVRTLRWLDVPPQAAVAQALGLLQQLGALDEAGRITSHGTAMLELGIHPRLAHMVCRGRALGCGALACDIAALLGERDILRGRREGSDVDIATRLQVLHGALSERGDMGGLRRVREAAVQLRRQAGIREGEARPRDDAMLGVLLAFAYPDRIAQARAGAHGRFRLSNGQGAWVAESDRLAANQYLVAAQLDGERTEARVFLAAALSRDDLLEHFREQLVTREEIAWGRREQAVIARRVVCLGQLVLREEPLTQAAAERIAAALLEGLREGGLAVLPWDKESRALWARLRFVATLPASTLASGDARWPDVSETALLATLESWLAPYLGGMTRLAQLSRLAMSAILRGLLTWQQQQRLDELAPSHVEVPSGSRIAIDYESEDGPILAVRLQELFGLAQTPRIAAGHVALKLHLLSPAYRPVQVTRDLASFWSNTYQDVKKDLKGRYPKHYWPDDPLQAQPTRGVRRR